MSNAGPRVAIAESTAAPEWVLVSLERAFPGRKVLSARERSTNALDTYLTYEAIIDDGTAVIVRQRNEPPSRSEGEAEWARQVFQSEVHILRWLPARLSISVPRLLHLEQSSLEYPHDAFITTQLSGDTVANCYTSLSSSARENLVRSYAEFAVELFKLDVPQSIGTAAPGESDDTLLVVPTLGASSRCHATKIFDSLEDYLDHVFTLKRRASILDTNDDDKFRAQAAISQLIAHFKRLSSHLREPVLRHCVLAHRDLRDSDIMIDTDGRITGVCGWRLHSIQPAILAAEYPPWLRYDGVDDPRFAPTHKPRLESPEEAARLRKIYEERVKALNGDYYIALTQGTLLRAAVGWVLDVQDDRGCSRMREWMLSSFGPPVSSPSPLDDARCIIS
ncbi:hypothetical protein BV22DRAFT_1033955 [Leucogyrophana mollusca]|uniref:Uncharacterized protein n=1 Tax=Leucogyrophana mollusca TaxID=85980 RepID=A0ACB8BJL4_9AGAM|nr:hypothetical protein BV22DRAFT_1033955 [Leucogyrophana mollusca]